MSSADTYRRKAVELEAMMRGEKDRAARIQWENMSKVSNRTEVRPPFRVQERPPVGVQIYPSEQSQDRRRGAPDSGASRSWRVASGEREVRRGS